MGRLKALENAIKDIERAHGVGSIVNLVEGFNTDFPSTSSGSLSLDAALGIGGYPKGRIIEIFGPESSGKTTLALHAIAEVQKNDGIAAFIDVEHAISPPYAQNLGVDLENLILSQPDSGEEALDIVERLAMSGSVDLIVIDSVAALVPRAEIEGEMGDAHVGLQARLMSQALRKLASTLNRSNTTAIFINQIREKIGVMFGNPETTPGGRALKFYSSVRIDVRRRTQIKDGHDAKGNLTRANVVKNKVAPPFRVAEFDIVYGEGISRESEIINLGVEYDIVTKSGSWYSYGEERLGQGQENSKNTLRNNPDLRDEIEKLIRQKMSEEN